MGKGRLRREKKITAELSEIPGLMCWQWWTGPATAHCVLEASMMWGQNMVVASIMALQPLSDFESQLRYLLGNVNLSELHFPHLNEGMTAFTT